MRFHPRPLLSRASHAPWPTLASIVVLGLACFAAVGHAMTRDEILDLRQETRSIFYHGLTNYRQFAYPEDELRPLTCRPLSRDGQNPTHIEVNDVLGNYSLSIVDSLSTLAILASSPTSDKDDHNSLDDFQDYVRLLVEEYGDGSPGPAGRGKRARGFDLDSKVQVFETTIRGLGGLLSSHLFAIGELPIRGYTPDNHHDGIHWPNGFVYDGQLLRLAQDLGQRLLPAFHTPTGLPYPRVNLRHGTPFYQNSPLNNDPEHGQCHKSQKPKGAREITETCSAGAGSLVLEFTTLSRLTNDTRFERLAKRAFWAVWERRSASDLIGAGIDAETGAWIGPWTGIGAGIDSFFEYSVKSHVLLSALEGNDMHNSTEDSPAAYLQTWEEAHSAILRHVYRDAHFTHPHYAQNDLYTGGPRLTWIDSLSAYYPGLLVLAGELDEAITAHLLYTALWSRYGALPERWDTTTGAIHGGLRWWGGRPEFIESTWYLYHATKDPWYLHIGEMALRDINRRCYTKCGWAGLQDVRTGEQSDRMESFFLGETAKYLYLLFDPDHPLNSLDAPWVFTTEGHPLIIPKSNRASAKSSTMKPPQNPTNTSILNAQCPLPPPLLPFTISPTAARSDVFHAASLARLHLMPFRDTPGAPSLDWSTDHPSLSTTSQESPSNFTYYPWTLPLDLIPSDGFCAKLSTKPTFDLTFPILSGTGLEIGTLQKIDRGVLVNSISGLRFGMVLEHVGGHDEYRIYTLGNFALGRDEHIALSRDALTQINPTDPHFTRMRDTEAFDLIIDVPPAEGDSVSEHLESGNATLNEQLFEFNLDIDLDALDATSSPGDVVLDSLPKALFADVHRLAEQLDGLVGALPDASSIDDALRDAAKQLRSQPAKPSSAVNEQPKQGLLRFTSPAMLPSGPGAASLPPGIDTSPDPRSLSLGSLPYQTILVIDSDLCSLSSPLPLSLIATHNILVIRRGGCSFSKKLAAIPSFPPSQKGLQLVLVISFEGKEDGARPLLEEKQATWKGLPRRNLVCLALVPGGDTVWEVMERAALTVAKVEAGELEIPKNKDTIKRAKGIDKGKKKKTKKDKDKEKEKPGIGVRRRFYFTSNGIKIGNLIVT